MRIRKYHAYAAVFIAGTAITGFAMRNEAPRQAQEQRPPAVTFLDVRTDAEWEAGHLDGAVHLDLQEIQQGALPDLPKDAEIKVYCRSGKRAETAKGLLEGSGFSNVENAGGYEGLAAGGKKSCTGTLASCQ